MKKIACLLFLMALVASSLAQKINTDLLYLVKQPLKKSAKTPVLIMMHGYGSNEADLFELSKSLDERLIIFSLRAPRALPGGGFCWYSLDFLPDQKFSYQYQQAEDSRNKILSFISQACLAYGLDSSQVFLMGFSQGSIMAYDIALSAPSKIKGVIALSGRMMAETKVLKTDWTKARQIKFFIAHGMSDPVIKIADGEAAKEFLKSKQPDLAITYNTYNMPHTINASELADLQAWLVKALLPAKENSSKK